MKYLPDLQRVFISFASADRDAVAAPVARALTRRGYSVWYDDDSLVAGDSLRSGLDEGLRQCDFGIVILSEGYFESAWTNDELSGLIAREKASGQRVIIPIWHNITQSQVSEFSPILSDRVALSSEGGIRHLVRSIVQTIQDERLKNPMRVVSFLSENGGRLEIRAVANCGDGTSLREAFSDSKIEELQSMVEIFTSNTTLKKNKKKKFR